MWKTLAWIVLFLVPRLAWAVTFNSPLAYPVQIDNAPTVGLNGTTLAGPSAQPPNALVIQPQALFNPTLSGPVFQRQGLFGDTTGRALNVATDGVLPISIVPPFKAAQPANTALVVTQSPTPSYQCPFIAPINQSANTTVITNPGGKRIYVCNAALINGTTAQSVTINEGTGTTCGTGTTYWLGGSGGTAALAVNGGFALIGINWAMQTAGDNVCVIVSGSTNVSGTMTYGIF